MGFRHLDRARADDAFAALRHDPRFRDLAGEPTGSRPSFIGETVPFELPSSKVRVNVSDLHWQGT